MPRYLFTYHAYGSWMPNRARGYVKRRQGILPADDSMAAHYRTAMKQSPVELSSEVQFVGIDALLDSCEKQRFELYYIASDATHVHVLLGWRDERTSLRMRGMVKGSISRRLKHECGKREWLAEGGSRKRVRDMTHFDYLVAVYLPRHRGWKWSPDKGKHR